MGYHNVRDENGRFTRKGKSSGFANRYTITRKKAKTRLKRALSTYDMFIIDMSGSMHTVVNETLEGFNTIVSDLKKVSKSNKLNSRASLILFNDEVRRVYNNLLISDFFNLTESTYKPSGMTALYDAIFEGINSMKEVVKNKNASVNVHIFTDGHENASHIRLIDVQELIKDVRDNLNWTVTFVGAGDLTDVKDVAHSLGIFASNTMNYAIGSAGTTRAFSQMSASNTASRVLYSSTGTATNDGFFSNEDNQI